MNDLEKNINQKKEVKEYKYPNPSELKISTITIITNTGGYHPKKGKQDYLIDLDILSRFVKINDKSEDNFNDLESAKGGITYIDYYPNITRGITKGNCPFYNQATVEYSYWGFRTINVKIFNNGKLQMTGVSFKDESEYVAKFMINRFKKTKYRIYKNSSNLPDGDLYDYAIVYNPKTAKHNYYRHNYINNFNDDIIKYKNKDKLKGWISDTFIYEFVKYLYDLVIKNNDIIKTYENKISRLNDIIEEGNSIQITNLGTKNIDITDPESELYKLQTELDNIYIKNEYMTNLYKRLNKVRTRDIETKNAIINKHKKELDDDSDSDNDETFWEFPLLDTSLEYKLDGMKIELINSNYHTGFPINNTPLHKILNNKYKLFSSYKPDDYPGVKTKFLWNKNKKVQNGICNCKVPCISLGKKSVCVQITIAIFQSGSVIITGAKSIKQINDCYDFINNVFKCEFNKILSVNKDQSDVLEINKQEHKINEIKKMSKKKKLFYIKKEDIKNLPLNICNTNKEDKEIKT